MIFRDLNMETSLRVFCGNYIKEENVREISDKYWQITKALELVNFPFGEPGFLLDFETRSEGAEVWGERRCGSRSWEARGGNKVGANSFSFPPYSLPRNQSLERLSCPRVDRRLPL